MLQIYQTGAEGFKLWLPWRERERGGHFFEDKKIFLIARYEVLKNSQYCQMQFDGFEIPGSSRQHSGES